jgi:hypothetical protein
MLDNLKNTAMATSRWSNRWRNDLDLIRVVCLTGGLVRWARYNDGASVAVLVGEVVADLGQLHLDVGHTASESMKIGVYEAMVRGSKVVKAFRRFCVQLIGSEGMLEHGLGHSEPRHSCPDHFILYTRSAMGPTTMSWLASPIRARGEREWDSIPYAVSKPIGVTKPTFSHLTST